MSKKESNPVVIEPNVILDNFHSLELNELRVLLYTVGSIYIQNKLKEGEEYYLNLEEYAEVFKVSNSIAYDSLVTVATRLVTRTIKIKANIFDKTASNKAIRVIHFVDMCQYDPTDRRIKLRFSKELVYLMNNLGEDINYTKYLLKNIVKIKTVGGFRLFRLLSRWKFSSRPKELALEDFKLALGLRSDEYSEFDNFNRKYIKPAMGEISKVEDLGMGLEWVKSGRKVTGVRLITVD